MTTVDWQHRLPSVSCTVYLVYQTHGPTIGGFILFDQLNLKWRIFSL